MAIDLKFCISNKTDCKTKCIVDTTGAYSLANPGGYGTPNPEVDDFDSATLLIEKRESDGTFVELATTDLYPTLPNITETPFCFGGVSFGQEADTVIPDGIYRATYTIQDGVETPITANITFAITCSIDCCYKKLADKAAFQTCPSDLTEKYEEMSIVMRALEAEKKCGDVIVLNNLIEYLTKSCASCGCGCQ